MKECKRNSGKEGWADHQSLITTVVWRVTFDEWGNFSGLKSVKETSQPSERAPPATKTSRSAGLMTKARLLLTRGPSSDEWLGRVLQKSKPKCSGRGRGTTAQQLSETERVFWKGSSQKNESLRRSYRGSLRGGGKTQELWLRGV